MKRYIAGTPDNQSEHDLYKIDNYAKLKLPKTHRKDVINTEFHSIIEKAGITSHKFEKKRERTNGWRKDVTRKKSYLQGYDSQLDRETTPTINLPF